MPRNSSGSMTLVSGNPVVSGTQISATTHNATMNDVATELSDSLSRSGKGGMTAPLRTVDGSQAAPSHSFTSDTDTGLYAKGANNPAMSVGNSEKQEWTATGSKVTGTLEVTGTVTAGAQVNLASVTSDPSSPADGAVWYRSDTDKVKARVNGATESVATETYVHGLTPLAVVTVSADGSIVQQKGRSTVTASKTGTGVYRVDLAGVTANGMVTVSTHISAIIFAAPVVNYVEVRAFNSSFVAVDSAFTLVIWAL